MIKVETNMWLWLTDSLVGSPYAVTTISGMESMGWALITQFTQDIEVDTDEEISVAELKKQAILNKIESVKQQQEEQMMKLEDELRLAQEIK